MGHAPREVSSFANEALIIENALVPNGIKALAGTFGSPAIMALGAFDPWLCVTAFRQLCPFVGKRLNNMIEHFEDKVKYYSNIERFTF